MICLFFLLDTMLLLYMDDVFQVSIINKHSSLDELTLW